MYVVNFILFFSYLFFVVTSFFFFSLLWLINSLIFGIFLLFFLFFVKNRLFLKSSDFILKYWVLLYTWTVVILSLGLCIKYLNFIGLYAGTMTFMCDYVFFESAYFDFEINYLGGVDGISMCLIRLSLWLLVICVCVIWHHQNFLELCIFLYLLVFFCVNVFYVLDLFLFYIFFELVLVPMLFIIGYWGSRERRIGAMYRFFFYTFVGSMGFLVVLFYLISIIGTVNYYDLYVDGLFSFTEQIFLWFLTFMAFAIKVPLYPVHTWLPEAHAEAPTVGSIMLAGVLLKLGPYGMLRFSNFLFPQGLVVFQFFVVSLCLYGVYYTTLIALRQIDLKKIIAYSSIGHMSFVVLGLCSFTYEGYFGGVLLMIGHGFVSSGLFLLVGSLYERYHTRSLLYYRGLIQVNPLLGFFMFLFVLGNVGFPGSVNFIAEFFIFLGVFDYSSFVAVLLISSTIFVLAYNLWFYSTVFFGEFDVSRRAYRNDKAYDSEFMHGSFIKFVNVDLVYRERLVVYFLLFPVIFFGFYPKIFFVLLNDTIINLLLINQYFFVYNGSEQDAVVLWNFIMKYWLIDLGVLVE